MIGGLIGLGVFFVLMVWGAVYSCMHPDLPEDPKGGKRVLAYQTVKVR